MTNWRAWQYCVPLIQSLPASGEKKPLRRGYIVQKEDKIGKRYTELSPLEDFHGVSLESCWKQFLNHINGAIKDSPRHSVTQMAIDILDLPQQVPAQIPLNALVDLRYIPNMETLKTFKCIKIKMGRQPTDIEINLFFELLGKLPSDTIFRIDANRSWTMEKLKDVVRELPKDRIEYFEEPLINPQDYFSLADVPIAIDESILSPISQELLKLANVMAVVLKPSVIGGIKSTIEYVKDIKRMNKKAILSSTFESSIGLWAISSLADSDNFHGLDTLRWFTENIFDDSVEIRNGYLHRKSRPFNLNDAHLQEVIL